MDVIYLDAGLVAASYHSASMIWKIVVTHVQTAIISSAFTVAYEITSFDNTTNMFPGIK